MTPSELSHLWHTRTARALHALDEPYNPRARIVDLSPGVRDVLEAVAASLLDDLDDELEADVEAYRAALRRARRRRAARVGGF